MEFMGFHIVDIVIVVLVAFLAIKGLVNGFAKELFNFIGIVGGVVLAARYNTKVIQYINEQNLGFEVPADFTKIAGFVLIVFSLWILITLISSIITKFSDEPSGFFSRLLGYILSAARYVFIFSLIVFGISKSEFFKDSAAKFKNETQLFSPMSEIGAKILNIDANTTIVSNTTNSTNTNEINLTNSPLTNFVEYNASN